MLTATIKTAVSEHEISMMRIRMQRAARQKAEQGVPKWKRAFGYLDDTHQPDPKTAPLVKQGYAAVLAGGSITTSLASGTPPAPTGLTGKPWTPSTVSAVSACPAQRRTAFAQREIIGKGTWPATGGRVHVASCPVGAQRAGARSRAQDGATPPADRCVALRQTRLRRLHVGQWTHDTSE